MMEAATKDPTPPESISISTPSQLTSSLNHHSIVTMPRPVENVWKYPRPPALLKTAARLRVVWKAANGEEKVVADTNEGWRVLETSHPVREPRWQAVRICDRIIKLNIVIFVLYVCLIMSSFACQPTVRRSLLVARHSSNRLWMLTAILISTYSTTSLPLASSHPSA